MRYDLKNALSKANFEARVHLLLKKGAIVELTEKRPQRTLSQNALFHLWIGVFADYIGETDRLAVKRDVLRHILGRQIVKNIFTLEEEEADYHTHKMTDMEMGSLMDKFKAWAMTDYGVYLPYIGDPGYEELVQNSY